MKRSSRRIPLCPYEFFSDVRMWPPFLCALCMDLSVQISRPRLKLTLAGQCIILVLPSTLFPSCYRSDTSSFRPSHSPHHPHPVSSQCGSWVSYSPYRTISRADLDRNGRHLSWVWLIHQARDQFDPRRNCTSSDDSRDRDWPGLSTPSHCPSVTS
jgi:hypothetical protein